MKIDNTYNKVFFTKILNSISFYIIIRVYANNCKIIQTV